MANRIFQRTIFDSLKASCIYKDHDFYASSAFDVHVGEEAHVVLTAPSEYYKHLSLCFHRMVKELEGSFDASNVDDVHSLLFNSDVINSQTKTILGNSSGLIKSRVKINLAGTYYLFGLKKDNPAVEENKPIIIDVSVGNVITK